MQTRTVNGDPDINPGLSIIHANHLEDLRQVAVQWIREHPLKPLENELFIVRSNGMAQWLKLALAEDEGCGIGAALDFQLPARFLWYAYRCVLGKNDIPPESPFDKMRLTWRLLRLIPFLPEDEHFAAIRRFLSDDGDLRKRYQLARHLADLYDQYQVYRADWLKDWAAGSDQLRDWRHQSQALPEAYIWQAQLWRRICADVPAELRATSRSALHRRFMEAAEMLTARSAGLPRRIMVFGICSLPQQVLEALNALSRCTQVLMFVHNPCRYYWADILEDKELLKIERFRHRQKSPVPENPHPDFCYRQANPLLAAWGKQGRDYIGLLYQYDQWDTYQKNFSQIDIFKDVDTDGQGSLLRQVQQAILDLAPVPSDHESKPAVAAEDRSICFHLAYNRQREVEILQDQLLALFDSRPETKTGLKPGEIIVMTPDINAYAPHIEAVFGNLVPHDPRYIPFTIADRPESGSQPLLQALETLLQLPDSRMTVSDVLDLLEVPAFRERFGLSETDLPQLHRWSEGAGIRWGFDAGHRQRFDLPGDLEQNTWRFGLNRMLLGYAVGSGEAWQGIEPYDEIGGLEAARVGSLAAMLAQLERYAGVLAHPASPRVWHRRILAMMADCFVPVGPRDRLLIGRLQDTLEEWLRACNDAQLEEDLSLPVVREAILSAMHEANMSQRFLAGMVNFCTLMPMRAIPFKVVCLLGMNDGDYPRTRPPLDFDLMAMPGYHRPGDRSRREDDRYLFLEALLSAREKFYISYIGRSVQDNSERMPSVLVGQLRDYLASGWRMTDTAPGAENTGERLLAHLTCSHPLQPFSKTYFQAADDACLFTYAHEWREILEAEKVLTDGRPSRMERLNAMPCEGPVDLGQLIAFMKNPVRYFFNQRLKIYFDGMDVTAEDREPFRLDRFAGFDLGAQLLEAGLAAEERRQPEGLVQAAQRLRRTGDLPLNRLGEIAALQLMKPVEAMLEYDRCLRQQWPHETTAMEIRWPVRIDGCRCEALEDWLDGLYSPISSLNGVCPSGQYARWEFCHQKIMDSKNHVSRRHCLIGLWVKHLAACALGIRLTGYLIAPDGMAMLPPMDRGRAGQWLQAIIHHWWLGLNTPLPITAKTGLAYLGVLLSKNAGKKSGKDDSQIIRQNARDAARKTYQGDGFNGSGELGYDRYLARLYPDFDAIWRIDASEHSHNEMCEYDLEEKPGAKRHDTEHHSGEWCGEPPRNRFEELAATLYAPLVKTLKEIPSA